MPSAERSLIRESSPWVVFDLKGSFNDQPRIQGHPYARSEMDFKLHDRVAPNIGSGDNSAEVASLDSVGRAQGSQLSRIL
jgi:hypothetical protein